MKPLLFGSLIAGAAVVLTARRKLFAAAASGRAGDDGRSYHAVDDYIEQQMRRLRIPGLALAVVEGERTVYQRGFGRARPGGGPPTSQTPFALGSTTKSFTALAVMQLAEAGNVELDAPVQRYLPWFRVADPRASARMTVRHLLNQTSGMSMVAGTAALANLDDRPDALERQARALSSLRLSRPVGTAFQYCNLNYSLLGLVIEAASGRTYATYIQERILAPLGMSHTYTSLDEAERNGLAQGHRYWFGFPTPSPRLPFPRSGLPAGGLYSTSEDLARYLIAHLNGGRCGDVQLLSAANISELHRGVAEQRVLGAAGTYAMGWFVGEINGTRIVFHGGNVPDFSSFIGLVPERAMGIILLVNADHGFPFILTEVGEGVTALLAGQQPRPLQFGFLPWMIRASPLVPTVQLVGIFATLQRLRRWRNHATLPPAGKRLLGRHILLPLIPHISLAAALLYLRSSGLLRFMDLYLPDLAWIARVSGGLAIVWAILRTALVVATRRTTWREVGPRS